MRVVVDGLPIGATSLSVVVEHVLEGWQRLDADDDIHLVVGPDAGLVVPSQVKVHRVRFGRVRTLSRLRAQNAALARLCRNIEADVLLGVLPTTAISPLPCPRAIITHDLRHQLRPDQFSTLALQLRRISYGIGFRQADAVICVSERTRTDLLQSRAWLRERVVRVALHGADHALSWGPPQAQGPDGYAIAFGQYENKNVDLVIDAWAVLKQRNVPLPLVLVGLPTGARRSAQERVAKLDLADSVTVLPWLPTAAFRERFLAARLVVFPSDFEGFGLPAVEAMRLGIPVVVTPDPALLEVTGGFATVMEGSGPAALADAVTAASATSSDAVEAARSHAATFTWERSARAVRDALSEIIDVEHRR